MAEIPTFNMVTVINKSTVVSELDARACAAALHVQLNRDFAPIWRIGGSVEYGTKVSSKGMALYLFDDSDQANALGYHDVDSIGTPFGRVFARIDGQRNLNWTVTASHELLELMADPFVFSAAPMTRSTWTALEVCDACEADALGYRIDGILVSDFLTPQWFGNPGSSQFDFTKKLRTKFSLARGGYISVWSQATGWTQKIARKKPGEASRQETSHRHLIRVMKDLDVVNSEPSITED
jgi:hypothetical protein